MGIQILHELPPWNSTKSHPRWQHSFKQRGGRTDFDHLLANSQLQYCNYFRLQTLYSTTFDLTCIPRSGKLGWMTSGSRWPRAGLLQPSWSRHSISVLMGRSATKQHYGCITYIYIYVCIYRPKDMLICFHVQKNMVFTCLGDWHCNKL